MIALAGTIAMVTGGYLFVALIALPIVFDVYAVARPVRRLARGVALAPPLPVFSVALVVANSAATLSRDPNAAGAELLAILAGVAASWVIALVLLVQALVALPAASGWQRATVVRV